GQVNALPKVETVIGAAGGFAKSGVSGAAGFGAAINLIGKVVRSTGWRTLSAATKGNIADALANGQFGAVADLLGKAGVTGRGAQATDQDQDQEQTGTPISQNTNGWVPIQTSDGQKLR